MKTWQDFAADSGTATTTWNYNAYRGWLDAKRYPLPTGEGQGEGTDYTYTSAGRLKSRVWARGVMTWYTNNPAGDLSVVNYTDSTPDVTYTYDRRGRQATIAAGGVTTTRKFNDAGNLLSEAYSGGPLNGLTVTNRYDVWLRRATNGLWNGSIWLAQTRYGYDDAGRLRTVATGTNTVAYSYLADSPLVGDIWFTNGSTLRMTTTKSYDYLNRLTAVDSRIGVAPVSISTYGYNPANQRTSVTNLDNARWIYTYDSLGQVVSGKKYWSDGTRVAGQQSEFSFDDIGNRRTAAQGGDQAGNNLRPASYGASLLNQYTSRTVPGYVNVLGTASNTATVTLWGDNGAYAATVRKAEYFRGELYANNSTGAVWLTITNVAMLNNGANPDLVASTTGRVYVPKTTETFAYDADGNLTNDGRWSYTWDAENRITSFTRISSAPSGAKVKVDCQYDSRWRRTQKIVSTWNGSAYVPQITNRFVYDGWNLIAILDHQSSILYSFTWGTDASGTLQGAGGVGGLISMTVHQGTNAGTYFYCYDGNHSVVALVNAANGVVAAQWEYEAFGNLLRATGPMASENTFLFSTKFYDWEMGFYYYGYRYYDPETGRWLNHDPAGEHAGVNLYAFVANSPVATVDVLGRWKATVHNGLTWTYAYMNHDFNWSYADIIAAANQAIDDFPPLGWESSLPLVGQQDRHMFYLKQGEDSLVWWYKNEYGEAIKHLKKGERTRNEHWCRKAAEHFGKGLHSLQDKSAHRTWPEGRDWDWWTMHPAWWDAYHDSELGAWGLSEDFWNDVGNRNLQTPGWGENYIPWYGTPGQQQSQEEARQEVRRDTDTAVRTFEGEVRKTCFCQPRMLKGR